MYIYVLEVKNTDCHDFEINITKEYMNKAAALDALIHLETVHNIYCRIIKQPVTS